MKFNKFKKASFWQIVKFKVKWIVKILWNFINYPFDLFDKYI